MTIAPAMAHLNQSEIIFVVIFRDDVAVMVLVFHCALEIHDRDRMDDERTLMDRLVTQKRWASQVASRSRQRD